MRVDTFFDAHFESKAGHGEADRSRARLIRETVPPDASTVLEVGAGTGLVTLELAEQFDVTALEISSVGVRRLREQGVNAIEGSVSQMPFDERSFDVVVASEVVEHLDASTYHRGLQEIARIARSYVLLTVPNRENLVLERQECPACRSISSPWTHLRSFDRATLTQTLSPFGFEAVGVREFGPPVPDGASLRTRLAFWHRFVRNPLRAGFLCGVCGYRMPGSAFARPCGADVLQAPAATVAYVLDGLGVRLAAKKPRWLLALFARRERGSSG